MKKKILIGLIIFLGIQIFCQQVSYPPYTKTRLKQDVETSTFSIINSYQINATTITIKAILLNGTTITSLVGDNLGNHIATTTLNMSGYNIINVSTISLRNYLEIKDKFRLGDLDPYGRRRLWYYDTNSVLKLGGAISDGDGINADSEGIVVIHQTSDSIAKIKADGIGLTRSSDSSYYYFRADKNALFYKSTDTTKTRLYINNTSGNVGIGTSNPSYKLDVNGGTIIRDSCTVQGVLVANNEVLATQIKSNTIYTDLIKQKNNDYIEISTGIKVRGYIESDSWVKASSMSLTGNLSLSQIIGTGGFLNWLNLYDNLNMNNGTITNVNNIYTKNVEAETSVKTNKITPYLGNAIDFSYNNFNNVGWVKASSMSLTGDISVSTIVASGDIITNGNINTSGNITTNGYIQCEAIDALFFRGRYSNSLLKINYINGLTEPYVRNINVSTITFSDGTILTSTKTLGGGGVGDNLGNHTATQNLNMSSYAIVNVSTITFLDGKSMISVPILATVYVAASNAPAKYKAMADYVCDGVNDEVEIQNAVNYVNSIGGGKILLSPGTFYFSNGAVINLDNKKNIIIEGESQFTTFIIAPGRSGYPVFGSQTPGVYVENFVIRNVYIYTNLHAWARYPIGVRNYEWRFSRAKNYVAENIICDGYYSNFSFWDGESVYLINCEFRNDRSGNPFGVKNGLIKNCKFLATPNMDEIEFVLFDYVGGSVYPENIIVDGNIFDYTNYTQITKRQVIVRISEARNCIVSNNICIYNNTGGREYNGIYLQSGNYNIRIIGNTIINNRVIDPYGNYEAAISLGHNELTYSNYYSSGIIISNNQFVNCTAGIKIYRISKYNYLMITNNQARNVNIPFAIVDKSYIGDNYQFYLNSWETTLDFDKGIVMKSAIFSGDYQVGISTPTALKQMIVDNNYDVWVSTGTNTAWDWVRADKMNYKTIYRQDGSIDLVKEYCGRVDIPANSSVNVNLVGATQILDVPIITPKGNYWVNCFITTVAPTYFTIQNNSANTIPVGWRAIAK